MSGEVVTKDHYQVCVRILEGRNLAWNNMNPVVKVEVGKSSKTTRTCLSTDSPYFNEYFVFDFVTPLADLLDTPITISVMHDPGKFRTRKLVGIFRLDVGTVWKQPDHQFYHKWAVLEDPDMISDVSKGFLKCDIRAAGRGDTAVIPPGQMDEDDDDIEGNLLSLTDSMPGDKVRARYEFTVYRAERISAFPQSSAKVNPLVSMSFAGCTTKTNVCNLTLDPEWNQTLVFREALPPLWQRVKLQLLNFGGKPLANTYLHLGQLSNDGKHGFLPTFGPAFLNLYSGNFLFRGRILLSLRTAPVDEDDQAAGCTTESADPLNESKLWNVEEVTLCSVVLGAGCLPKKVLDKQLTVHLAMGSNFWDSALESVSVERVLSAAKSTTMPLKLEGPRGSSGGNYCSANIGVDKPCACIRAKWPDFRLRMYVSNALDVVANSLGEYVTFLQKQMDNGEQDLNIPFIMAAEEIQQKCTKFLAREYYPLYTHLDGRRYQLRRKHVESIRRAAKSWQKDNISYWGIPKRLEQAETLLETLKELVEEPQDCLPDVMISLMVNGEKVLGYGRKSARDFIYSNINIEAGQLCGKITTLLLKDEKKPAVFPGTLTLLTWLGYESDYEACMALLPPGFIAQGADKLLPANFTCLHTQEFLGKVHIYQGRFIPGSDRSGLADPFVRVTLADQTYETKVVQKTLNPTWDETVTFRHVSLSTSYAKYYKKYPPQIILEVFDKDKAFGNDLMGRMTFQPLVKLFDDTDIPMLAWLPVYNGSTYAGDLLIAAELIQQRPEDLKKASDEQLDPVSTMPSYVRPHLATYRIEVVFWGVRDLKRVKLLSVSKPQAILEINGVEITSTVIPDAQKNPNFPEPLSSTTLKLPEELDYLPPAGITVLDHRTFGRTVLVGSHLLSNLVSIMCSHNAGKSPVKSVRGRKVHSSRSSRSGRRRKAKNRLRHMFAWFRTDSDSEYSQKTDAVSENEDGWTGPKKPSKRLLKRINSNEKDTEMETIDPDTENFDWWTKFYAATKESVPDKSEEGLHSVRVQAKIKVYAGELEKQPEFRGFQDRLKTFPLYKGKRVAGAIYEEKNVVGRLKMSLCLYRTPKQDFHRELILSHGPSNLPMTVVARVYCVRAFQLHARDPTGYSDPYVEVCVGDKKVGRREDYVAKQLDPVFGRMLEVEMLLPLETQLTVRVMDWDAVTSDDLIGETVIDVEDRLYSRHRATCGLSTRYDESGYNEWRDIDTPRQILRTLCRRYNYARPVYLKDGEEVNFGPHRYEQINAHPYADLKEQCALAALHTWLEPLVPEHVETRSLYRPDLPGLEQGKLQMWVDLFVPRRSGVLPTPVDISPRKFRALELRVIVWNTSDVVLDEYDVIYGGRSSDIYVKAWVAGSEKEVQSTDVHYRSLDGEGNFNWRMVFPLQLLPMEERLVVSRKETIFSRKGTNRSIPPRLYLQVWDCDHFSPDDFLGELSLNLRHLPHGSATARACNLKVMSHSTHVNLFKVGKTRGWWPFAAYDGEKLVLTGKVELQMEVLSREEADKRPAGKGWDPPQSLDKPVRPESSFFWMANPLGAFKHVLFRRSRKYFMVLAMVAMAALMVLTALYSLPGYTVKKLIGA